MAVRASLLSCVLSARRAFRLNLLRGMVVVCMMVGWLWSLFVGVPVVCFCWFRCLFGRVWGGAIVRNVMLKDDCMF